MPQTNTKIKPKTNLKEPPNFKVIYLNDDVTTVDFVVQTLVEVFDYDQSHAESITQQIHDEGRAIVAVLPFEMAEQKGVEVTRLARDNGFPLVVKLEEVS